MIRLLLRVTNVFDEIMYNPCIQFQMHDGGPVVSLAFDEDFTQESGVLVFHSFEDCPLKLKDKGACAFEEGEQDVVRQLSQMLQQLTKGG